MEGKKMNDNNKSLNDILNEYQLLENELISTNGEINIHPSHPNTSLIILFIFYIVISNVISILSAYL